VVIPEQRNHHHRHPGPRSKPSGPHFTSPSSSRGFRGMNCRSFHSGGCIGVLPPSPPPPARTYSSPEAKTPKQQQQLLRHGGKCTRPISISPSTSPPSRSELWAGPAFSNSPPPSSLPIPKFPSARNAVSLLSYHLLSPLMTWRLDRMLNQLLHPRLGDQGMISSMTMKLLLL